MAKLDIVSFVAATAQAAYSNFANQGSEDDKTPLTDSSGGEFAGISADRLLGDNGTQNDPFGLGITRIAYTPDQSNGFSAAVFRRNDTGQAILAIRGTNGPVDLVQDAKLVVLGVATDQAISLYRYYRC